LVAGVIGVSTVANASTVTKASASAVPAPVAAGPALFGGNTAVALDSKFLAALKALQVQGNDTSLTGTTVHVSSTATGLLDSVFETTAVKGGLLVGIATITAQISK
jgi:hypothetical protein